MLYLKWIIWTRIECLDVKNMEKIKFLEIFGSFKCGIDFCLALPGKHNMEGKKCGNGISRYSLLK